MASNRECGLAILQLFSTTHIRHVSPTTPRPVGSSALFSEPAKYVNRSGGGSCISWHEVRDFFSEVHVG